MRRLPCWIFGHRYEVWQHFSRASRRVVCDNCSGDWGMHDGERAFVPWDGQIEEMYVFMGHRIRPRTPPNASGEQP